MIELSTQASVPQSQNAAAGIQGATSGASGFLRLFEIVLGGMPQGGQIGSVVGDATLAEPGSAEGASVVLPLDLASGSGAGLGVEGMECDVSNLAMLDPAVPAMSFSDAVAISELLGNIGFSIDPKEIASLGPLDRQQLSSAMEFLQRGVQAGMSGDDLLESVSCLMPREWDFQGGDSVAIPRSEGLAPADEAPSGIDPAQILACAEMVRQILGAAQSVQIARTPAAPASGDVGMVADVPASSNAVKAAAMQASPKETGAPSAPKNVTEAVTDSVGSGTSAGTAGSKGAESGETRGTNVASTERSSSDGRMVPADARRADATRRETVASAHQGGDDRHVAAAGTDAPSATRKAELARIGGGTRHPGFEIGAKAALAQTESAMTPTWGANPSPEATQEAYVPIATQGVRAGSMASEFIGRQVLEKVDVQLKQGRRELNVRLWPEELGEVRLSLRIGEADKLDARIMVQTESVRQAILDATPQLREALARHGMEMGKLSVNIDAGMTSGGGASERDARQARDGHDRATWRGAWQEEEVEYGTALALGVDSGYRDGRNTLDMWS